MTLVPGEREAEHEFVGQCIRHIKRQLKRAWPTAFDTAVPERIFVQPNSMGQQSLKTKENYRFPEIPNLFLASHILANQGGEVGSLELVRDLQSIVLGGNPSPKHSGPRILNQRSALPRRRCFCRRPTLRGFAVACRSY